MESIIAVVEQNPIYGLIGALLVVFVIVSLLKKLLFVALCAVAVLAGFTFYLQSTGQEVPERTGAITERLVDTTKDATRKLENHCLANRNSNVLRFLHCTVPIQQKRKY